MSIPVIEALELKVWPRNRPVPPPKLNETFDPFGKVRFCGVTEVQVRVSAMMLPNSKKALFVPLPDTLTRGDEKARTALML